MFARSRERLRGSRVIPVNDRKAAPVCAALTLIYQLK